MDSKDFNPEVYRKEWQWKEGDLTVTRSTQWSAPGCHCACSVLLYTDAEGKLVKVEGDPQSPMTEGRLCMRCFALPEAMYHEKRITTPLKRAREHRGKDAWEQISWNEAYDLIEAKVRQIWAEDEHGNGRSILVTQGTGRNIGWHTTTLALQIFDSPNQVSGFLSGDSCWGPRMMAASMMTGGGYIEADVGQFFEDHFDNELYKIPDLVVVWGTEPFVSSSDGFYAPLLLECLKRGTKLLVVDPRVTWLAARAEVALQLRPGTDGELALGIIKVMIEQDLYDHDFVENWTFGFEQLRERVAEVDLDDVERITRVSKTDVARAARLWTTCGTSALKWGLALDQMSNSTGASQAVLAAEALTGSIEKPGGTIFAVTGRHLYHDFDINDWASVANDLDPNLCHDRIGFGTYPLRSGPNGGLASVDLMVDQLESGEPFPIRMCVSLANNWISCMGAQQNRIREAARTIEFVVVGDVVMTPTAMEFGDLFLPAAMGPERDGLRDWFVPVRAITKVTQTGEARSDEQVVFDLGKRLHPERFPWDTCEEMLDFFVHDLNSWDVGKRLTLKDLREGVTFYPERRYMRHVSGGLRPDNQPGFPTPTGKFEFYSNVLASMGLDPLPHFMEPPRSPLSTPELMEEYPYVLTTGRRSWEFFHSEHRHLRSMREFHPDPLCEINPEDAAREGVREGDWVWIENGFGKARFRVKVTDGMLQGVVSCEHAWWFPERAAEDEGFGCFAVYESNANQLTSMGECGPSSYGSPYKSQICKISRDVR